MAEAGSASLERKAFGAEPGRGCCVGGKPLVHRASQVSDPASCPAVSVIMPCRNEARFIGQALESLLTNDYPMHRVQFLIVDGMSGDGTRAILQEYAARNSNVQIVDNPKATAPCAMNIGISHANGDLIIRADAHAVYRADYITKLVYWSRLTNAENVGGVWITRPNDSGPVARSIAMAVANRFGVGNAYYRVGVHEPRWVDTVPFGCYRRDIFERVGLFDEQFVRNQDDEFNFRLVRSGGRILLAPDVCAHYYARGSLGQLWRTYYQYGYFKPLVLRKHRRIATARQLAPPTFVLALITGLILLAVHTPAAIGAIGLLGVYGLTSVVVACLAGLATKDPSALLMPLAFAAMHFGYGCGFLRGVVDWLVFARASEGWMDAT